jgi:dolichol-phosphate mannosyltransferase
VPIVFQDRTSGTSKMNKGIVKEGILGVIKLRWHSLFKNYRKRVKKVEKYQRIPYQENEIIAEGK